LKRSAIDLKIIWAASLENAHELPRFLNTSNE
jgi:hypothetical protein